MKNKLDSIFIIGVLIIALLAGIIDAIYWHDIDTGGFPVYTCISIYVSYAFWVGLLIYYFSTKEKHESKPDYASITMFFGLAFIHVFFAAIGLISSNVILNLFN